MKSKDIFIRLSRVTRILSCGGLVVLALLSLGLWVATVSAQPTAPIPSHILPTRPPRPKPKPPSQPREPSQPTPEPSLPAPTATPPPTPTPHLTADLALYPGPFFELPPEHTPIYFVLPENPSAADLSAAATIAAGLGKFSGGEIELASILDTEISAEVQNRHHLIVVGQAGANRFLDKLKLPLRLDDPAFPDDQGVIQELVSPWNPMRMVLVVTGTGEEGLRKASQALNQDSHLRQMEGNVAIVQTVSVPELDESHKLGTDFTLADLGYEETVVFGIGSHTLKYHLHAPPGVTTSEENRLTLYFAHAVIASPARSSLDVYFNDVPVASVLLDEGNASEGTLDVSLPSWLVRPDQNQIRISIEMDLDAQDQGLYSDTQDLWTAIYSRSSFHLPFSPQDMRASLDLFPHPFNMRPSLSGLMLVLPDFPRQIDHDLMLMVAAGMGAVDRGDHLALHVATAGRITQEDHQDRDLFLVGQPSAHSFIAELNKHLPQPFEPGSDLLKAQFESVVYVQDPSRSVGVIEELAAPWDPERTVLVLTGTTDEGVILASTTLLSLRNALTGNVVLVEESAGIQALDTRSLPPPPVAFADKSDVNRTLLIQLGERWW